jgi:hypothetical protein
MNTVLKKKLLGISKSTFFLTFCFSLFFHLSKKTAFLATVNSFSDDPFDFVNSVGFQAALFISSFTLARATYLFLYNPDQSSAKFILRGNMISALTLISSIVADFIAEFVSGSKLIFNAGFIILNISLLLLVSWAGWVVFQVHNFVKDFEIVSVKREMTNSSALFEAYQLTIKTLNKYSSKHPLVSRLQIWTEEILTNRQLKKLYCLINPRIHPIRFKVSSCICLSLVITLSQLYGEGVNLEVLPLLFSIFFLIEATCLIVIFFALDDYLNITK